MPELPEVETVKRTLSKNIIGKKIEQIEAHYSGIIKFPSEEDFREALVGKTICEIGRKGKFLLFYFEDVVMVSHLRMEGKYGVFNQVDALTKHDHVVFKFTDGTELRYKDVRKFGTMHLFEKGEEFRVLPLSKVGCEPFEGEYTFEYLKSKLSRVQRKVKPMLLDQTFIAGLGNIYVDETLFRAGVHPERLCNSLTDPEIELIRKESVLVLEEAIEAGGSTVRSYTSSTGEIGLFQLQIKVYGRAGEPCLVCSNILEKSKVGGRGTVTCPRCQQ